MATVPNFSTTYQFRYTEGQDGLAVVYTIPSDTVKKVNAIVNGPDLTIDLGFTLANLLGYYIKTDNDITIETNASGGVGGDVINLGPEAPLVWFPGCPWPCALTKDVTKIILHDPNPTAGTPINVQLRFTLNS
jgi:hypothetical protein